MSNFIRKDLVLPDNLNKNMQYLIDKCIEADNNNDYASYEPYADMLVNVACRDAYASGAITKEQWSLIERKFGL